jgi:hypothetical protein
MRFQDRDYETQLAKVAWWLRLADYWNERDRKFAEMLSTSAREIQRAKDQSANMPCRRLPAQATRLSVPTTARDSRRLPRPPVVVQSFL